jgi:hypothetical protein
MTYWRMQLHPSAPGGAIKHTVESLSAGYVGLDFAGDIPDLKTISQSQLPETQKNYWGFAHEMERGDQVLLFTHHFPFALARVTGEYNYVRAPVPELGVWFRHFRSVDNVKYYGDFKTNAKNWKPLTMTATITPLRDIASESFVLIEEWLQADSKCA